jgi:hypothetical protein
MKMVVGRIWKSKDVSANQAVVEDAKKNLVKIP